VNPARKLAQLSFAFLSKSLQSASALLSEKGDDSPEGEGPMAMSRLESRRRRERETATRRECRRDLEEVVKEVYWTP